jgi:hypothetical protein
MEQAPGPPETPQVPPPQFAALRVDEDFSPPTAKLETCWRSFLLSHLGQTGFRCPSTMASNWWSHSWQMYSKIGIFFS